jgi:hypothetical protein
MPADAEIVTLTPTPEQPPITKLFTVLQSLMRLRDNFSRDKDPNGRLEAARAMRDRADELVSAACDVLREVERNRPDLPARSAAA